MSEFRVSKAAANDLFKIGLRTELYCLVNICSESLGK